jgi:hypothetical protein
MNSRSMVTNELALNNLSRSDDSKGASSGDLIAQRNSLDTLPRAEPAHCMARAARDFQRVLRLLQFRFILHGLHRFQEILS